MRDAKHTRFTIFHTRRPRWISLGLTACVAFAVLQSSAIADTPQKGQTPPDIVYERLEENWSIAADGGVTLDAKRHYQLNSDRVYYDVADPRITYDADYQKLEVLTARVRLPNGKYVDLPDYGQVEVAPDAAAGWPAYTGLRQRVLVMSGIETGAVIELDYRITSKPGALPYLARNVEIDRAYPVQTHIVSVTVPGANRVSAEVTGLSENQYDYALDQTSSKATHRWMFGDLPARENEPQALPWPDRGVRLAFTSGATGDEWIEQRLAALNEAADDSDLIQKLAKDWTLDTADDAEKLAALQKHLHDTYNFVNFDASWRTIAIRPASVSLADNYGLSADSAAALLALARAAGLDVRPGLLAGETMWTQLAPQHALVSENVVLFNGPDGVEVWRPRQGRIHHDRHWAGDLLLSMNDGRIDRIQWPAWTNPDASRCHVTGAVQIKDDGTYTGKLTVRTSGLFVSPGDLDSRDDQKGHLKNLLTHALPGAEIDDFSVQLLAPNKFEARMEIHHKDALDKLAGRYLLQLADEDVTLHQVAIPHVAAERETTARLAGAFDSLLDLTIEWPEEWQVDTLPGRIEPLTGPWGELSQTVTKTDDRVRWTRRIRITQRDLPADTVMKLRTPLNTLRTAHARSLLLAP